MRVFRSYQFWLVLVVAVVIVGCCTPSQTGLTPPTLLSLAPASGSTTACPTSVVTANFSEPMTPGTINATTFTLAGSGGTPVTGQVSYNATGNLATFTPSGNLTAGASYIATVTTGAQDLYGNALAANAVTNFSIAANGCNPPPMISTVMPAAGTAVACPTAVVTVNFNEAMNASTINSSTVLLKGPGGAAVAGAVTYNSNNKSAIFTPTSNLAAGTTYSGTVTTGVQDLFGNPLAVAYTWSFITAANGCNPAPLLLTITPGPGSTTACPNAAVVATFNEPMNPATINAGDFTLSPSVVGTVTHDVTNTIFTLTPSSSLASNTLYTSNISTAAQDVFGNSLANAVMSSFTTAANGCHPPPTVSLVTPAPGLTGVCPNKVISIKFSEPMSPTTLNAQSFQVAGPNGTPVTGTVTYDPASNTATFAPAAALALSSLYTVTITTAVQDTYGNTLGTNYVWSFTTGASTCLPAPPPVTVTPANGASAICPGSVVSVTFAQAMNPATLNAATFLLTGAGGVQVAGAITHDTPGKMFTFTPTAALALNTIYTATITTGAQDTFGNPLASNYTWTFTTGATSCVTTGPPTVTTVAPLANAIGVCTNAVLSATFSEAMDPATISATTITLSPADPGTVALDSTGKVATYTPNASLALNTTYTATITTGAKDTLGNPLVAPFVWSFMTSTLQCQPPVPLGTAANFEILAASTVTSTGPTVVTGGDIGLSPGTSITGFPQGLLTAPAMMQVSNLIAAQGQLDLTIAYNYTAGLPGGAALPTELSGKTLTPGLYNNPMAVTLSSGNLTLDAQGNPNAVFIFQIGSTLITLGNTQVVLVGGALAKNVFWQVGSSATLGTNSVFEGTIMALQSITLNTGASLQGRALARTAAVTLDSNVVTAP
jgi:hypothetical protein